MNQFIRFPGSGPPRSVHVYEWIHGFHALLDHVDLGPGKMFNIAEDLPIQVGSGKRCPCLRLVCGRPRRGRADG